MGARGNILVRAADGDIYLYTHWGGSALAESARIALAKDRSRWMDGVYLRRIVLEAMIGDERGTTTGFGISRELTDNQYHILVLNCITQTAHLETEEGTRGTPVPFDAFLSGTTLPKPKKN